MDAYRRRWELFASRPFPEGIAGREISGVCLATVDTFTAGCVQTFFAEKSLDAERQNVLSRCLEDLRKELPGLEGDAADYFSELAALAEAVLRGCRN
jgi:hypothetical protein